MPVWMFSRLLEAILPAHARDQRFPETPASTCQRILILPGFGVDALDPAPVLLLDRYRNTERFHHQPPSALPAAALPCAGSVTGIMIPVQRYADIHQIAYFWV